MTKNKKNNEYISGGKSRPNTSEMSFSAKEAYNLLRTNLIFSFADDKKCHIIGITSAMRGDGKSLTAINVSSSIAESGRKVLLIDGDMRLPRINSRLNTERSPGLSNLLVGMNSIETAIHKPGSGEKFVIIPSGDSTPNPSELLGSKRMELLLDELSKHYEYIIIDLPPVNIVPDALAVSGFLSGLILVVRDNMTSRRGVAEMVRQIEFSGAKILGFVFNSKERQHKVYGSRYKKGAYDNYYKNYAESNDEKRTVKSD